MSHLPFPQKSDVFRAITVSGLPDKDPILCIVLPAGCCRFTVSPGIIAKKRMMIHEYEKRVRDLQEKG
jgi:hypothetical protein